MAGKYQDQNDLLDLKRSALHSHYRQQVDKLADVTKFPKAAAFLPNNFLPWIGAYLKYVFRPRHRFVCYPRDGDHGIYPLKPAQGQVVRVSIAGDWGTGTEESEKVASAMHAFKPDYTIHLGDVYFVGDKAEIDQNCLGVSGHGYQGIEWPRGRMGSFAMNGNHEMYASGDAYFAHFLPRLGIPSSRDQRQLASYFCLENDIWRILALDTGYNSAGMPLLGALPFMGSLPGIRGSCKLEEPSIEWLGKEVDPKSRRRATILLTHHQCFSAFEKGYGTPSRQLQPFFEGQEIIWLWGHEHRFAVYDKYADHGPTAYARCLGHGGMPVELAAPKSNFPAPLRYYDKRLYRDLGRVKVGFNGFVNLELAGNSATFDYRDHENRSLLVEKFVTDGTTISQSYVQVHPDLAVARPQGQRSAAP